MTVLGGSYSCWGGVSSEFTISYENPKKRSGEIWYNKHNKPQRRKVKGLKRCVRFLWAALLLAGMGAVLCACGKEAAEVGRPALPQAGMLKGAELALPAELSVAEGDSIHAYRLHVDPEKAKEEIEAAFGITLGPPTVDGRYVGPDYVVTIDQTTGYWTYDAKEGYSSLAPSETPLSDEAAREIAEKFVEEHGLWTGERYNTVVTEITGGGGNVPEYSLGKEVYLYPGVEGKTILGVFRIVVSMDCQGRLFSVHKLAAEVGEKVLVQGKPRERLEEDLAQGNYSDSCSQALQSPRLETGGLAYYADARAAGGATYLYPVYVFTGQGTTAEGPQERFVLLIDAQG